MRYNFPGYCLSSAFSSSKIHVFYHMIEFGQFFKTPLIAEMKGKREQSCGEFPWNSLTTNWSKSKVGFRRSVLFPENFCPVEKEKKKEKKDISDFYPDVLGKEGAVIFVVFLMI